MLDEKRVLIQIPTIMSIKEIKKHNPQPFLDDLKRVREVMVYAEHTNSYYQILKKNLLRDARKANHHILYNERHLCCKTGCDGSYLTNN